MVRQKIINIEGEATSPSAPCQDRLVQDATGVHTKESEPFRLNFAQSLQQWQFRHEPLLVSLLNEEYMHIIVFRICESR